MGAAVGEHFAAGHAELVERAILQAEVEILVGVFLNGKAVVFEEREVLDQLRGIVEIDQNADPAAFGGREHGAKKPDQIEGRELALLGMEQDFLVQVIGEGGVDDRCHGRDLKTARRPPQERNHRKITAMPGSGAPPPCRLFSRISASTADMSSSVSQSSRTT